MEKDIATLLLHHMSGLISNVRLLARWEGPVNNLIHDYDILGANFLEKLAFASRRLNLTIDWNDCGFLY